MQEFNLQDVFSRILLIPLMLSSMILYGQSSSLGLNPPSLQWRTIDTEKVNVIYPSELENQAQYVANLVHLLWDSSYYALGERHEPVNIILQNQNTTSNGFVTISPFRSEFYLTRPQYSFLGNIDWLTGLTIHEYRHVQQFVNAKKSVTKIGSWLFGQNGWGATAGLALPRWFFEGDAVFYETALTKGGRGRMPDFENAYKALLLERSKIINYEKASATSYKEFIPNHYNLGYFMTTGIRRDFGNETMAEVVDRAVSYKSIIFPFSHGMKKMTGYRTPEYYNKLMSELKEEWIKEDSLSNWDSGVELNTQKNKTFTSYTNPTLVNDTTIIAFKSGYQDILKIVSIDPRTGKEKKLVEPGFIARSNISLSTNGRFIVWTQTDFHPRWELLDYSEIWAFNMKSKRLHRITNNTRFFTPAINKTGSRIAAIELTTDQKEKLVVINSSTGEQIFSYTFQENEGGSFPVWGNENNLYFIWQSKNTNALASIDLGSSRIKKLTPEWNAVLGYPSVSEEFIYFNGTFTGTDDIYRWHLQDQHLEKITTSRFGCIHPAPYPVQETLFTADYSSQGYRISKHSLNGSMPIDPDTIKTKNDFFEELIIDEPISLSTTNGHFSSKQMKGTKGLFNLHSWTPWFFPPNFGVILEADNIMSTFSTEADYTFNTNEMTSSFGIKSKYGTHFPVIELNASRSNRSRYVPVISQEDNYLKIRTESNEWVEDDISVGVTLPLNTTWKNYFSNVTLTHLIHKKWVNYSNSTLNDNSNFNESFEALTFDLSAYIVRRTARQHINPRLGMVTSFKYRTSIGTGLNESNYLQYNGRVYLPGIFKNHSLYITERFQKEKYVSTYKFRDDFFYTRGYGAIPHDEITSLGFNYSLPLLYPDIPLGPILFIQRIKANIFFDLGRMKVRQHDLNTFRTIGDIALPTNQLSKTSTVTDFQSYGFEITFDLRFLRVLDVDTGIRISKPLNDALTNKKWEYEFLLLSIGI
jgi:hypothetical protein